MARKKQKKKAKVERTPLFDDLSPHAKQAIWAVVFGIFATFFLFSLLDFAGPVGEYTAKTLRVLFGAGAWLSPLVCLSFIYVLLNASEETNKVSISKKLGTVLLFVSLLAGLELYTEGLGGWVGMLLEAPLVYLLDSTLSGILIFGLVLISTFLLFNTDLKLFSRREKTEKAEDDNSDIEALGLPEEEIIEDEETDEEEEEKASTGIAAMKKKVTSLTKAAPSEIVVKNFNGTYIAPSLSLLNKEKGKAQIGDVKANANTIKRTLKEFGISVEMDAVESGPTITRYALKPAQGVRIAKIAGLQQELQLALKASSIRIEAPIPGKSLVGIEVPNQQRATV